MCIRQSEEALILGDHIRTLTIIGHPTLHVILINLLSSIIYMTHIWASSVIKPVLILNILSVHFARILTGVISSVRVLIVVSPQLIQATRKAALSQSFRNYNWL